ncbi:hypothetical protein F5Y09DRAFT_338835 [Xylaria sp. FL1042]|nr:hypothetical protein F5Y09DRAFT_338835 [Xylaria sp. FL1042]
MSSNPKQEGPLDNKVPSPGLTGESSSQESFHHALVELSAALALLSVIQPQLEPPAGTIETTDGKSNVKQFERPVGFDFTERAGVELPEILWAFAVIFSPSRDGKHVVASVLREEPQENDESKSLFTLYLTKNGGIWSGDDEQYRDRWQDAVNNKISSLDFSSGLWAELINFCICRAKEYVKHAKNCFKGIPEDEKRREELLKEICGKELQESNPGIIELLKNINGEIKCSRSQQGPRKFIEECWGKLSSGDNVDQFAKLLERLRSDNASPETGRSSKPEHPDRRLSLFKCVDNLAKLPRAFRTFSKFQSRLVSNGAQLRIELLSNPEQSYFNEVRSAIDRLANEQRSGPTEVNAQNVKKIKARQVRKAKENIGRSLEPHCEIQMLQHFQTSERTGVWNVMGCSKRPCFACAKLLEASGFLFKESHGKAYHHYFLSAKEWLESNKEMKPAIEDLRRDVVGRVRAYREGKGTKIGYQEPDSPVFQDSNMSRLS